MNTKPNTPASRNEAVAWEYQNTAGRKFLTHSDPASWHPHDREGYQKFRALGYLAAPEAAIDAGGQEAGREVPVAPDVCPITGRKFWGNMEHPERGVVALYGGPYDSYTIPERCEDGDGDELRSERYDQDEGEWVEGGEPIGWFYIDQPALASRPEAPPASASPATVAQPVAPGLMRAVRYIDEKRATFDHEHGCYDPETGATEFGRGPRAEALEQYSNDLADLSEELRALAAPPQSSTCDIPPDGWRCNRAKGHEGPCAALSTAKSGEHGATDGGTGDAN
jgi:hypothetical protein